MMTYKTIRTSLPSSGSSNVEFGHEIPHSNAAFFQMNYTIIVLFVFFLSSFWHLISLIIFVFMMCAWLLLYFLRDKPLVIFHCTIDNCMVLMGLSIFTIVFLFLIDVTVNIVVGLVVNNDLVMVDEEKGDVRSGVAWRRMPLKEIV
ncbi:hypothetical protein CsSME_00020524 [Camellia sinensis var. sinensis]